MNPDTFNQMNDDLNHYQATHRKDDGNIKITVEDSNPLPYLAGICEAHEGEKYFVEDTKTGEHISHHKTFRKAYQTAHKMNTETHLK